MERMSFRRPGGSETIRSLLRRRGKQSVRLSAAAFRAAFPALFGQKPGGKAAPTLSAQATLARC